MKKENIIDRFRMIFTKEEIGRISFDMKGGEVEAVRVDVHGLKCLPAKRFINNIINLIRDAFRLIVIHGYNHGTAIRDMLRSDFSNQKIDHIFRIIGNDGVTGMIIVSRI